MDSLQGKLLMATPNQLDLNFRNAVILVIQHNDRGAYGVILNYPHSRGGPPERRGSNGHSRRRPRLFWGGPVAGPLMVLHTRLALAEREIVPGVFFSAKRQNVARLLSKAGEPRKFFVGYAGWGPRQLEYAVERGIWRIVPATPEQIFSEERDLWEELFRQTSRRQLQRLFHLRHLPSNPLLN